MRGVKCAMTTPDTLLGVLPAITRAKFTFVCCLHKCPTAFFTSSILVSSASQLHRSPSSSALLCLFIVDLTCLHDLYQVKAASSDNVNIKLAVFNMVVPAFCETLLIDSQVQIMSLPFATANCEGLCEHQALIFSATNVAVATRSICGPSAKLTMVNHQVSNETAYSYGDVADYTIFSDKNRKEAKTREEFVASIYVKDARVASAAGETEYIAVHLLHNKLDGMFADKEALRKGKHMFSTFRVFPLLMFPQVPRLQSPRELLKRVRQLSSVHRRGFSLSMVGAMVSDKRPLEEY